MLSGKGWPFCLGLNVLSWLVIEDGKSTSVYNGSKYLTSSLDWNRVQTAITNQPEKKSKEKR